VRAKKHLDLRIGDPERGLHSWAVRKGIPEPGEKYYAAHNPIHDFSYGQFEGLLPRGYGAGTVRKVRDQKILITKASPTSVHFTTASDRYPERFVLVKMQTEKDKDWLLINTTPNKPPTVKKPKMKTVPADRVDALIEKMQKGDSYQTKIDGALQLINILRDGVELTSYREGARGPIVHTERVLGGRPKMDIPKELAGTVLQGEVYGEQDGKAIPVQTLGGLLNSTIARSLDTQKKKDINLRTAIFDITQKGKQDVSGLPYSERRTMIKDILQHLPADKFNFIEEATTPEDAKNLWNRIQQLQHPLTSEGMIIRQDAKPPVKVKLTDEEDVVIREVLPGQGRLKGHAAGGFRYSRDPQGEIIGNVGSGFTDDFRRDLWENRDNYIGRTARVKSHGTFPDSGALRAPVLIGLHEG
jgi:ATP-dependent DNA ligase